MNTVRALRGIFEEKYFRGKRQLNSKNIADTYNPSFCIDDHLTDIIWCDLCMDLGLWYDSKLYETYFPVLQHCGWIYEFNHGGVIVCDRPIRIATEDYEGFSDELSGLFTPATPDSLLQKETCQRFHAEPGTSAIEYSDGFGIYAYHGVALPEKWGKLPSDEWQPQWLLGEEDEELKKILIQVIGPERIRKALSIEAVRSLRKNKILVIDSLIDEMELESLERSITELENLLEILLTEYQTLSPLYQQKWEAILLHSRIDQDKAREAINKAYSAFNQSAPEIRFYSSAVAAEQDPDFQNQNQYRTTRQAIHRLVFWNPLGKSFRSITEMSISNKLDTNPILYSPIMKEFPEKYARCISSSSRILKDIYHIQDEYFTQFRENLLKKKIGCFE